MALGTPTAPTPAVGAFGTFVTSAPFPITANALLFGHFSNRNNAITPGASTMVDSTGGALSWTRLTTQLYDIGSGARLRQEVYVAATVEGLGDIQVTHQCASGGQLALQLVQAPGTISIPVNFDIELSLTGSPSVTLPNAPVPSSYLLGFYVLTINASSVPTQPSGFTIIESAHNGTWDLQLQSVYDPAPTVQTNAWTGASSFQSFGTVVELRSPMLARARAIWTG